MWPGTAAPQWQCTATFSFWASTRMLLCTSNPKQDRNYNTMLDWHSVGTVGCTESLVLELYDLAAHKITCRVKVCGQSKPTDCCLQFVAANSNGFWIDWVFSIYHCTWLKGKQAAWLVAMQSHKILHLHLHIQALHLKVDLVNGHHRLKCLWNTANTLCKSFAAFSLT